MCAAYYESSLFYSMNFFIQRLNDNEDDNQVKRKLESGMC